MASRPGVAVIDSHKPIYVAKAGGGSDSTSGMRSLRSVGP